MYLHRKASNGEVFYVGKGKKRRAWSRGSRNNYWSNTVEKYGLVVDIVFDNLDENEAFQLEKDTILEMRYFGCNLVNLTNGGEGSSGFKQTPEQIQKRSSSKVGVPLSEEHRQKIGLAQRGVPKRKESIEKMRASNTGKKRGDATKQKISSALQISGTCNDRSVYCFFSDLDIFIGTRKELSQHTNIPLIKFKPLFEAGGKIKSAQKWRVLSSKSLLIFKEIIK